MSGDEERTPIRVRVDPMLEPIMDRYLEIRRREQKDLANALAAEDMPLLAEIAHRIKGSAAAYGLKELDRKARELEQAAVAQEVKTCAEIIAFLDDYMDRLEVTFGHKRSST